MKPIFIFIQLILLSNVALSQSNDSLFDEKNYEAKLVFEVDSIQKDELFSRVKYWIGTTYKSASKVIDVEDKSSEVYRIILKPTMIRVCTYWGSHTNVAVEYSVIIQIKDHRIKIEVKDFYLRGDAFNKIGNGALNVDDKPYGLPLKCWDEFHRWCKSDCIKLVENFEYSIINAKGTIDDDF